MSHSAKSALSHPLIDRLRRNRAAGRRPLVVLADHAEAAVERCLVALDDRDGDADVGEVHRDAATHRARAEHTARLDVEERCVLGDVGDLVGRAFGEEGVPLGGRLRAGHQLHEELALDLQALVERQVGGGLDALDVVLRGEEAAGLAGDRGAEVGEQLGVALRFGDLLVAVAHAGERHVLGHRSPSEGDRLGAERVVRTVLHLVDEPAFEGLVGADVTARGHHLECLGHAGQARQALGAAGTGQQSEVHLRQTELRRRQGHPIVRAECHFEPAAEGRPVDRGDHRYGRVLDHTLRVGEARRLGRSPAELGDVGAGDERAAIADQHDRVGAVGDRLVDAVEDALADMPTERVDGRVVDDDEGDVVVALQADRLGDGFGG
jgi:hypothetical protein